MMLNSKSLGTKITEARKKMNLSQAELAQQVAISPQAVGKWERGESIPDITMLDRLAEIFGLDLNYFSDSFSSTKTPADLQGINDKKPTWDLSKMHLVGNDFSGLKNLGDKLASSNMQRCSFIESDLSELSLKRNHIDTCDFTGSIMTKSNLQDSMLNKNILKDCNLTESTIRNCSLDKCDFSGANFTNAQFNGTSIKKNEFQHVTFSGTSFVDSAFQQIVFNGSFNDCSFENCGFKNVTFENVIFRTTFFKNNRNMKRVTFIDCKADKLTYEFLKNNRANLSGIEVVE